MTELNYEEMYAGITTEIYAPILAEEYNFKFFLTASLPTGWKSNCFVWRESWKKYHYLRPLWSQGFVTRMEYSVKSAYRNEGLYYLGCYFEFNNILLDTVRRTKRARVILNFFEGKYK